MLLENQVSLIEKLAKIEELIGNTKVLELAKEKSIFAKIEYTNFSGSIKDRAAFNIIKHGILADRINPETTIIESTSGNFGLSLALICIYLNIKFIAVVDANISESNKRALKFLSHDVVEINKRDETGGYLLNRLKFIEEFKANNQNVFHPDQYNNEYNYKGYYQMVAEINQQFDTLDYIIIAVSTGGTISGISKNIKRFFPNIKVIAVDVKGSQIFSNEKARRTLSGIGASKKSSFIDPIACIDEVLIFSEEKIKEGCKKLNIENGIFAGISSGATYCGAMEIKKRFPYKEHKMLLICPDRGAPYFKLFI